MFARISEKNLLGFLEAKRNAHQMEMLELQEQLSCCTAACGKKMYNNILTPGEHILKVCKDCKNLQLLHFHYAVLSI